ncbi:MAG: hypothetical protein JJT94_04205 [Bernardetiaceae bacterium]|nr:hypothetical protein [Bernardetiaceae bacterium]
MHLIEVKNKAHAKAFLQLPVRLYKDNPFWIRPLDNDIEAVFDPKKNSFFSHGECTRWILQNAQGITVGRVAAFINQDTVHKDNKQPTGGMGFFECINDQDVAFKLFDTAKKWLEERNIEAMDGPINFGDRSKWWGLLVEGFDIEPSYCMPYNPPYYQQFFENYGFQIYFKQFTFGRKIGGMSDRMYKLGSRIYKNPDYKFISLDPKQLHKFMSDFRTIYNKSWAEHSGAAEMSEADVASASRELKPILDPQLVWFAYYKDEPVGFYVMLPEVNQIIKHLDGKLDAIGKLKFLWHQYRGSCRKVFSLIFGVVPEHQRKGVELGMTVAFSDLIQSYEKFPYDDIEFNWIGDFHPKMLKLIKLFDSEVCKTHITYRKLFDPNAIFERAPEIK